MRIERWEVPSSAFRAYHEGPTIEKTIANIMSLPDVQVIIVMRMLEDMTDAQILRLFKGYHDEYDVNMDRTELRDILLEKARKT